MEERGRRRGGGEREKERCRREGEGEVDERGRKREGKRSYDSELSQAFLLQGLRDGLGFLKTVVLHTL